MTYQGNREGPQVNAIKRALRRHPVPYLIRWAIQRGFGLLTYSMRLLPDFIIIGAQRCGTTSLYNYLMQHPSVFPSVPKEVHFFSNHFNKGITWYRSHFPFVWRRDYFRRIRHREFITGEATPYYIFHPHAPRRISETVPQAKLIALLRNPVDRAYSHYYYEVKLGAESLSFEDAMEREKRLPLETAKILEDEDYRSFDHQNYSYLSRGIYINQLDNWARYFDRTQILVLKSEDLYGSPSTTLEQVFGFIDLPNWELNDYRKYNPTHYPEMNAATRKRLVDYFRPHNQRLYEYLGVDFDWDK